MRFQVGRLALAVAALPALCLPLAAQTLPPLDRQPAWTEGDKAEFLRYLNSSQTLPSGEVKVVAAPPEQTFSYHEAWALEAGPAFLALFPMSRDRYAGTVLARPGVRATYEGHLRPWMRVYTGLQVNPMRQQRLDGGWAKLTRWSVPAGLEFALVPLSLPQTRYVLIRLGVSVSDVVGRGSATDFAAPLLGITAAWNLGLGYEWQIPNSSWRLNASVEGLRSIANRSNVSYYGFGGSAAVAYTF